MKYNRVTTIAMLCLLVGRHVSAGAQGDRKPRPDPRAVSPREQRQRVDEQQRRATQYKEHLDQQVRVVHDQTEHLQDQRRSAQYRAQQEYAAQLVQQQQRLQTTRNFATDPIHQRATHVSLYSRRRRSSDEPVWRRRSATGGELWVSARSPGRGSRPAGPLGRELPNLDRVPRRELWLQRRLCRRRTTTTTTFAKGSAADTTTASIDDRSLAARRTDPGRSRCRCGGYSRPAVDSLNLGRDTPQPPSIRTRRTPAVPPGRSGGSRR